MPLIYFIAALVALFGAYFGHQHFIRFERLNGSTVLNTMLAAFTLFTLLMIAYLTGYFPQSVAAPFMIFLYSFFTGFFTGYALRLMRLKKTAGEILYMHRSFWVDHAPGFAAMLIILYGIYRTSLLLEQPVTGIRLTSGLSLTAFGFFAWTVKIIPEFRSGGILFLDKLIPWKQIVGWQWKTEDVIGIDYLFNPGESDEQLRELSTSIPPDDRKQIQSVLESEMEKHNDEREELLKIGLDRKN